MQAATLWSAGVSAEGPSTGSAMATASARDSSRTMRRSTGSAQTSAIESGRTVWNSSTRRAIVSTSTWCALAVTISRASA